jgi:hypothetical protein
MGAPREAIMCNLSGLAIRFDFLYNTHTNGKANVCLLKGGVFANFMTMDTVLRSEEQTSSNFLLRRIK